MTFELPTKGDLDRALSLLMHGHRHRLMEQCALIKSDAAKRGALGGNRVIVMAVRAADDLHKEAMTEASAILLDYVGRMKRPPAEIISWARPHLENLGNSLLGVVPPNNFPEDHQRLARQYRAVFEQRVAGMLRDVEIGFVKGAGFARAEQMESTEQWLRAADASRLLKAAFNSEYLARQTICKRAHSGLIRARAERYMIDKEGHSNCEVPREFWWAEGEAALTQNWTTGDFETWLRQQVRLQAFGVSFLRADIEKMIPTPMPERTSARAPQEGRAAIMLTALDLETRAVLRHLSDIRELTERGTVFHVGQFGDWTIAVAECGEGNVHAAATVERGIAQFRPDVAMFVGVAGGIKDVSIGDALVSTKVYGYERGKDTGEGFKPRPAVELTAYELEQRARAIRLGDEWRARLDPKLKHTNPQIYVGPIAAGEKVVSSSSGKVAEFLREHYGDALGVEMEGHGFLAGLHINPTVQGCVVRGISDLLDGKSEADKVGSQGQAADVASAVAFELLATLRRAGRAENASGEMHDERSGSQTRSAAAEPAGRAPTKPSAKGEDSTVIFARRFAAAFPGVRSVEWFDAPTAIKERLAKLLEEPLEYADATPIWWSRGHNNLQITSFVEEGDRYLLNGAEMSIRRIAAVGSSSYKHQFVYVDVAPLAPTGLYAQAADRIAEVERGEGPFTWYWEEYGVVDGKHLVTRSVYDDGSAVIEGHLQSIEGRAKFRSRHVTPYNFVIAAANAPILQMGYDETLGSHLDAMLKGEDRLRTMAQEILRLPTGRW
jgi:nucleoside phosphorylase